MENEEIRGLINKKDSEDQFASSWLKINQCNLLSSSSLELSHYSLSLSLFRPLRVFLDHSNLEKRKEKARKGNQDSSSFSRNTCR